MKIFQVPFCFLPDPIGGTEVYVQALAQHLQQQDVSVTIVAPGKENQTYVYNQLPVRRFGISSAGTNIRDLYGEGDKLGAIEFGKILDEEQPNLIHLHAFTAGASLALVRVAKQKRIPIIFTYHTPTVTCQRGTLMRWGRTVCDGKLDLNTCASCTLQGLGLNRNIANVIGRLPLAVGRSLGAINLSGGVWTALSMTELVALRHGAISALMCEVDRIVAVCDWARDALILNQVPPYKITVIRQGLCYQPIEASKVSLRSDQTTLRLAFLGRLDPTKGIHILIQALQTIPQLAIALDIYGISQGKNASSYQQKLQALAKNDLRINFKASISPEKVTATLADYDLLAVPSQWLETGPMVVMEAFAAGLPAELPN
jgi:glycosyltransferase involved in cell wall biosynthesis